MAAPRLDFHVSPAGEQELGVVLELVRSCDLLEAGVTSCWPHLMLARSGEAPLGCAGLELHGEHGLLRSVAVDVRHRGRGVARALVAAIEARAQREALTNLYLLTTTAAGFFERLGFRAVQRAEVPSGIASSWEYRAGCPATATVMRRGVNPAA